MNFGIPGVARHDCENPYGGSRVTVRTSHDARHNTWTLGGLRCCQDGEQGEHPSNHEENPGYSILNSMERVGRVRLFESTLSNTSISNGRSIILPARSATDSPTRTA